MREGGKVGPGVRRDSGDWDKPPAAVKSLFRRKPGPHIAACTMFFAYLLASKPHGTLYTGSTSDLVRRVWEHKLKAVPWVTAKYAVDRLV